MKQRLKYGLLLILTLFIHCAASKTVENKGKEVAPTYGREECSVSQAVPIHNAIERLYKFYSNQPCDLGHTDTAHVPAEKSIQLLISYFREHKDSPSASYNYLHQVPKYLSDPITHYIYGLRKIII